MDEEKKPFKLTVSIAKALAEAPQDEHGNPLVCSGCGHSASSEPFPGKPSGERPCCFCIRNPGWEEFTLKRNAEGRPGVTVWYDGSEPIKVPMDNYRSVDMAYQISVWNQKHEVIGMKKLKAELKGCWWHKCHKSEEELELPSGEQCPSCGAKPK